MSVVLLRPTTTPRPASFLRVRATLTPSRQYPARAYPSRHRPQFSAPKHPVRRIRDQQPVQSSFSTTTSAIMLETNPQAVRLLNFLEESPSPYHAVQQVKDRLSDDGFAQLHESEDWSLKVRPGGKYFFTRNNSSIIAFAVGGKFVPGNGFSMIAAHTDSPCLKVKPHSKKQKAGYLQVGVETYGGGLWYTWFDRDLSAAGRVIVEDEKGVFSHVLVNIKRPILHIPSLAIHLNRDVADGFKFNKETNLLPILASVAKGMNATESAATTSASETPSFHHPAFLKAIADEIGVDASRIRDFELCLYDTQKPALGGLKKEFITSARLDNLCMSFCATSGLLSSLLLKEPFENDPNVRLIALFDHEEVGSQSTHGAASNMLQTTIDRLSFANGKSLLHQAIPNSFLISADMAHAVHPNYSDKHEDDHRPEIHKGPTIKINSNQRYATTTTTGFLIKEIAKNARVPIQEFVVRNDSPCGTTVGPILAANVGLRTMDIGNPQFAMHSIREICGTDDVEHAVNLFEAFFNSFAAINQKLIFD